MLERINQSLHLLSDMEQTILQKIYVEDKVIAEVGRELGYSRSYISRIHSRMLQTLRTRISRTPVSNAR